MKQAAPGNPSCGQMRQPIRETERLCTGGRSATCFCCSSLKQSDVRNCSDTNIDVKSLSAYMVVRQELACDLYDLVY